MAANEALVERFYSELVNAGNLAVASEIVAPDFVDHGAPPGLPSGIDGLAAFFGMLGRAFPDLVWTTDAIVSSGDVVVARGHLEGTHRGEFMGVPATGRRVGWTAIHWYRVAGGRLAERWSEANILGVMRQIQAPAG